MRGDGRTGDLTEPGDDVDDAWGETGLFDEIAHVECGEGGLLGGLEDDGVAAGDGGTDFPRPHEEREVPGDDLTADTNLSFILAWYSAGEADYGDISHRLLSGVVESLGVGLDDLTLDLVGPSAVISDAASCQSHVDRGHPNGFTII